MASLYEISNDILRIFNDVEVAEGEITDEQYDALQIKQEELSSIQIDQAVTRRTPILITLGDFRNIESFELPNWMEDKIKSSKE